MKIYTKVNLTWDEELQQYVESSSESYEYAGEVALAKGGGGGSQQQVVKNDPWSGQQPYLKDLFRLGSQWLYGGFPADGAAPSPAPATGERLYGTPEAISRGRFFDEGGVGGLIARRMAQQRRAQPAATSNIPGAAATGGVPALPDYTDTLESYARARENINPYVQALTDASQQFVSGDLLTPESNPALQGYLDAATRNIMQSYQEQALPQIAYNALASENVGSSRQGVAEGLATQYALDAVGDTTANILNTAYGQGLQATLAAQAMAPQVAQMQLLDPELAGLLADFEDQKMLERIKAYQSIVGGGGYGGTQTTTGPATESGGLAGAIGGASMGAGIGGLIAGPGAAINPLFPIIGGIGGLFS